MPRHRRQRDRTQHIVLDDDCGVRVCARRPPRVRSQEREYDGDATECADARQDVRERHAARPLDRTARPHLGGREEYSGAKHRAAYHRGSRFACRSSAVWGLD